MKNPILLLLGICLLTISLQAQEMKTKSMNVTIYNSNFGVVREIRGVDLKSGVSELKFTDVAKTIDPTTVHIKFDGNVLEQNYQYDLASFSKILSKYIDKEISLVSDKITIEGKLLSVGYEDIVLQQKGGGLLMLKNFKDYRINVGALPEGLITKPTLVWKLESSKSGKQDMELSYQADNLSWHAEYVGILSMDEKKMDLSAWVSLDNQSGATYKNSKVKLVAGEVKRIQEDVDLGGFVDNIEIRESRVPAFRKERIQERTFFDYHIYELDGMTDISDNETKQISLFNKNDIPVKKKYYYRTQKFNSGNWDKVAVVVEFENSKKNNLGIPLPKGKLRMNKQDNQAIEFIGEDVIEHTPKDEKVEVCVGNAFDIVAEEKITSSEMPNQNSRISEYEVTIKNRKEEDVVVEMERTFGTNSKILASSLPYEAKDAFTFVFKIPATKSSEIKMTFKVREQW